MSQWGRKHQGYCLAGDTVGRRGHSSRRPARGQEWSGFSREEVKLYVGGIVAVERRCLVPSTQCVHSWVGP